MPISDSNNTDQYDNTIAVINGGTDNTPIGNVGDSLKVTTTIIGDANTMPFSGGAIDAFGRLRTCQPYKLFELTATQSLDTTRYIDIATAGGGSGTHEKTRSSIKASVDTASGSYCYLKSRAAIPYVKGSSQLVKITGCFAQGKTNLRQRYGMFDTNNGIYFEIDGTTPYVVVRSNVTGSIVNTRVAQSSWNVDKLDGTGASGLTYDHSKQTVYMMDFGWLGSHAVRFYIDIGNTILLVHEAKFSNQLDYPYMRTPVLPIRGEIENLGTTASASDMRLTCASVEAEGSISSHGKVKDFNTGTTAIAINATPKLVAGIRIDPNNIDSVIDILEMEILPYSGNDAAYFEVIYNPTIVGGTWADVGGGSVAEALVSYTSFSGGAVMKSGYFPTDNKNQLSAVFSRVIESDVAMGSAIDGTPDPVVLSVRTITGNASIFMQGQYREMT